MLNSGSMEPDDVITFSVLRLSVVFTSGRGEIRHLCHLKETKEREEHVRRRGL